MTRRAVTGTLAAGCLLLVATPVAAAAVPGAVPVAAVAVPGAVAVAAAAVPGAGPVGAAAVPSACGPSASDALAETPWPLRRLRPELAWPLTQGAGVTVAVIDSGVSTTHPSLAGQVLPGRDLVKPGGVGDCDEVAHGTFVAGIIAGRRRDDTGFVGIAPQSRILPIRVLLDESKSTDSKISDRVADAIDFSVASGAQVINLSLVTQKAPRLEAAVADAVKRNVVIVAAAGNDGAAPDSGQGPAYPAALAGVIAVAGVDESDRHVATSTTGSYVDVAAPGIRISGPAPQGGGFGQRAEGGTSFAAPYVAGVAALVRAYHPKLTAEQIAERITQTADHPAGGFGQDVGYGVVNPYRAVTAIIGDSTAPPATMGPARVSVDDRTGGRDGAAAILWAAAGCVVAAVLVLAGRVVARRGRARSWQPSRASARR